ncbi:MAG: hypothetical protein IID45_08530 [Planctomycetes bacterium]|nr:hypothetical protein [Planctomycetota bacterium]
MNQLTPTQRKWVYLGGIAVLIFPIIFLGMPASEAAPLEGAKNVDDLSGGKLARLRSQYNLGESNLGNVDPSSATMNLVLVGLRGIAVNLLWIDAEESKKTKNWAQLKSDVESIILLQPHYVKVWQFQSWNLAYNVSAEWDLVADQFYWIKEGAKFCIRGGERNRKVPELPFWTGQIIGDKFGRHDAWRFMRTMFNPDAYRNLPEFNTKSLKPFIGDPEVLRLKKIIAADPDLNPEGKDNYLVAKEWYLKANKINERQPQHKMLRVLFRMRPYQAQMAYPGAMQREGRYAEIGKTGKNKIAEQWAKALIEWTTIYGEEKIVTGAGFIRLELPGIGDELATSQRLQSDLAARRDELKQSSSAGQDRIEQLKNEIDSIQKKLKENAVKIQTIQRKRSDFLRGLVKLDEDKKYSLEQKLNMIDVIQNTTNYRYWRKRAQVESKAKMASTHLNLHLGKMAVKNSKPKVAIEHLEQGLLDYAEILAEHPVLRKEDETVEEVMIAILFWKRAYDLKQRNGHPDPVPLRPGIRFPVKASNDLTRLRVAHNILLQIFVMVNKKTGGMAQIQDLYEKELDFRHR